MATQAPVGMPGRVRAGSATISGAVLLLVTAFRELLGGDDADDRLGG
ncbi:hypothetical protein [Mycobacterium gastri]|nr:hypothetical protein [Mycobacterium gastri]ETW24284.1 hypothetical protein MGAST_09265 [Mycobacterium gastri 'Wayne']